ncbi:MAG: FMN-binding negative transcriptional regulator [Propionicimonas sp.]|nr:FMN-binding negative transcriptional regulator [Propionicimonas sp.]
MRENPSFALTDPDQVRQLVREQSWMTLVSATDEHGLVVSHYPVMLDEAADGIVLLAHVGRPDEQLHELGRHEVVAIVQGPHGYVSSGWYGVAPAVPTWNFTVAHLYGTPEILAPQQNLEVLDAMVTYFERHQAEPRLMRGTAEDAGYAERLAKGTVGLRLRVERFVAKRKLSQNKPAETVARIIAELEGDGPFANPVLAADMRRQHGC